MEDYFIISESYYGKEMCGRIRDPAKGHGRSSHTAIPGKPKLQWRPQNVGNARTRKCTGMEQNWLKRAFAASDRTEGLGYPSSPEHNMLQMLVRAAVFGVFCETLVFLWSDNSLVYPHFPFWNENVYSVLLCVGRVEVRNKGRAS